MHRNTRSHTNCHLECENRMQRTARSGNKSKPGRDALKIIIARPALARNLLIEINSTFYLTSTVATPSNFLRTVSASSLLTFSFNGLGAPSTRSLASFSPSEVTSRTALMVLILLAPASLRMTVNSVFSSTGAAAAAPLRRLLRPRGLRLPPRLRAALRASLPEPPRPTGSSLQFDLPTAANPPFFSPLFLNFGNTCFTACCYWRSPLSSRRFLPLPRFPICPDQASLCSPCSNRCYPV